MTELRRAATSRRGWVAAAQRRRFRCLCQQARGSGGERARTGCGRALRSLMPLERPPHSDKWGEGVRTQGEGRESKDVRTADTSPDEGTAATDRLSCDSSEPEMLLKRFSARKSATVQACPVWQSPRPAGSAVSDAAAHFQRTAGRFTTLTQADGGPRLRGSARAAARPVRAHGALSITGKPSLTFRCTGRRPPGGCS